MSLKTLWAWFGCRHRRVLFDRVAGRAVWRCADCLLVRERMS